MAIYIVIAFPIFFAAIWTLVTFILSRFGWSALAANYRTDPALFIGTKVGTISGRINFVNYNHCLILEFNEQGILLRTPLLFRMFHPAILIPWNAIKNVEDRQVLFFTYKKLVVGSPTVATVAITTSAFAILEPEYLRHWER